MNQRSSSVERILRGRTFDIFFLFLGYRRRRLAQPDSTGVTNYSDNTRAARLPIGCLSVCEIKWSIFFSGSAPIDISIYARETEDNCAKQDANRRLFYLSSRFISTTARGLVEQITLRLGNTGVPLIISELWFSHTCTSMQSRMASGGCEFMGGCFGAGYVNEGFRSVM